MNVSMGRFESLYSAGGMPKSLLSVNSETQAVSWRLQCKYVAVSRSPAALCLGDYGWLSSRASQDSCPRVATTGAGWIIRTKHVQAWLRGLLSTGWHGGEPRDGRLAGDNGLEGAKRG